MLLDLFHVADSKAVETGTILLIMDTKKLLLCILSKTFDQTDLPLCYQCGIENYTAFWYINNIIPDSIALAGTASELL